MQKFKIGVIGCGSIAKKKYCPYYAKLEDVELTSFCDINQENAESLASLYGVSNAKIYVDYKDLISNDSLDIVFVLTPNSTHAEITIASLEANKHVICEKPMAITSADAYKMLSTAKKTGKKLTIGYQNRFRPDSQALHKACEKGELGEIYFAKAHAVRRRAIPTWGYFIDDKTQGGGPLIDIGSHALDLTLWMMNNYNVKSVVGSCYQKFGKQTCIGNAWGDWDIEKFKVEDSAFGFVKMKNDATVFIEASWALNTLDELEAKTTLCGTKAGADMRDGLRINTVKYDQLATEKIGEVNIKNSKNSSLLNDPNYLEAESFINCIKNNTEPVVLPEQTFVVTKIIEAIYQSAKTGETVYFND